MKFAESNSKSSELKIKLNIIQIYQAKFILINFK